MTVDQITISFGPDRVEDSSLFEWLSAEEMNEGIGGEPDDLEHETPDRLMPPATPSWPRIYPGL